VRELRGLLGYRDWLRACEQVCSRLVREQTFDVIHFVSYGSISATVRLWGLGVPFVLGPVGGAQTVDPAYASVLGPLPPALRFRNFRIRLLAYRPGIRAMTRRAAVVLATNHETAAAVRRCGGRTLLFCDTGIYPELLLDKPPQKQPSGGLRMLWVGRLLYRKAVPLALRALRATARHDFTLDIVGTGPMEERWRTEAAELGLNDQVIFHGQAPFSRMTEFYDRAELLVFPSVNDSFGSQLLEACARGLPILTLNHQGAGSLLPDAAACKVSVGNPLQTIRELAEAMLRLADPLTRAPMAEAALRYAHTESWPARISRINAIYDQLAVGLEVGS
jgi:glycosyltransferase involved in cell wall biosynthesis